MTSARGARAQYSQRHHRVAKKEAALSPQRQMIKLKKHAQKFIALGVGILVLTAIEWFVIGYLVGKRQCDCDEE